LHRTQHKIFAKKAPAASGTNMLKQPGGSARERSCLQKKVCVITSSKLWIQLSFCPSCILLNTVHHVSS
jgi:hypothetical protein